MITYIVFLVFYSIYIVHSIFIHTGVIYSIVCSIEQSPYIVYFIVCKYFYMIFEHVSLFVKYVLFFILLIVQAFIY